MKILRTAALLTLVLGAASAIASDLIIYPANGQSQEQQEKDKYQCYGWAKDRTGFDPMQQPQASSAPPADTTSSTGRSVVGGALLGAAVGEIASGDAGEGAAIGGLLGGMRSRNQKRQHQAEQEQWEQQQVSQYQAARNEYNRAYSACLEPRGYSVK